MKFRAVAFGAASLALLVGVPTAAGSAPEPQHCAWRLVPTGPTEDGIVSASLEGAGCFETFEEALEAGSGGHVTLTDGIGPAELTDSALDEAVTGASDVLLGTEYDSTNFAGASNSYFAPSGCAGTTWQVANVGSTWNDRFESGKGFGTCDRNRKFEHENFGGSSVLCTPNCGTYGILRNEITSLRWRD